VSPSSSQTGASGRLSSLPDPTSSGYTCSGWFTAETGGTQVTTSTVFTGNTTIYAQWTAAPAPVVTSIDIAGPATIIVTSGAAISGNFIEIYMAVVKDQNGNEMSGQTIIWSVQASGDVSITPENENCTVSVPETSPDMTFTLTAECGAVFKTLSISVITI
jgi:uncharacterized repeat protein (TIGR02543 family)